MESRLPNNLNAYFPGQNEDLLIKLDLSGIAASVGSACSMRASKVSQAVLALGYGDERAKASIRFTLGKYNTKSEIKEAVARIKAVL